ncbi:MAG: ExeM/NucH family extracellular endonuclease [Pseudomonadota bacterium]
MSVRSLPALCCLLLVIVASALPASVLAARIHDIQGSGSTSPMTGARVKVEGLVTGNFIAGLGGFFLQEESRDEDGDPATSEAVFVFCTDYTEPLAVGDRVAVTGDVIEAEGMTALTRVTMDLIDRGNPLPGEAVIAHIVTADMESLEAMRVRLPGPLTVVSNFNLQFGEIGISDRGVMVQPTEVQPPGPGAYSLQQRQSASVLILDDGNTARNPDPIVYATGGGPLRSTNTLRTGDRVQDISGVLGFGFGAWRLQPTAPVTIVEANPRPVAQPAVGGNFRVAAFNVLNYFTTLDARGADTAAELARQRARLARTLAGMNVDVIGLIEVENDLAGVPDQAVIDIVNAVNALGDPGTWAVVRTGAIGADQIKVALIYRQDRVAPVGSYAVLDSQVDPGFDDTKNRPALAQTFVAVDTGEQVTLVVAHLKSKGSACAGDPDVRDGQGNCNRTRTEAAQALGAWALADPTSSGDPDVLIMGDLNAYAREDPIVTLERMEYVNLAARFAPHTYSYTFNGQRGSLDYGLANDSLARQATGAAAWHINADEPALLDYNLDNGRDRALFDAELPYRTSDHDPLFMGFDLKSCDLPCPQ